MAFGDKDGMGFLRERWVDSRLADSIGANIAGVGLFTFENFSS
jgi:hypothetical protein